ncbi:MAG: hypothetical protein D6707_05355 [Bacteroidetes bacterium]|nr:MAG: hypothetical protein D6707_05355 [Bacteroidota bacterium]
MKIIFKPKSNLGKWSVGLIIIMPVLFFIGKSFVGFYKPFSVGKTIPYDIILRPGVALSMLGGLISGIVSFLYGILGIVRKKDYSILVFISTLIGFLVLLFILAEIIFPH